MIRTRLWLLYMEWLLPMKRIIRIQLLWQKLQTVQAYFDSFSADDGSRDQARAGFEQYADDELREIYIQELDQGDIAPVVGQKNVYFLEESAAFDADETYYRLNGPRGSYTEIGEGEFAGTSVIGNLSEGMYPMESVGTDEIADCGADTYTLDELTGDIKQ